MYYIIDKSTNPYWNLAAEEYLLKQKEIPIFRLWRNEPAIIIGIHQNGYAEINIEYVKEHSIAVVRRLSGGGAVFHDLGNINFTFIDNKVEREDFAAMFVRFTKPIIKALKELGVEAELKGRNDLVIEDKKFSGNAIATYKGRVLQHGTLLFSTSMGQLSEALISRPEHFKDRAVKSTRSRVTNIAQHLPTPLTVTQFMDHVQSSIIEGGDGEFKEYNYSEEDLKEIDKLYNEKYSQESWNFGSSPKYQYNKVSRFSWGVLELHMNVERGRISEITFYGSYFSKEESGKLAELLVGVEHNHEAIIDSIKKTNLSDYFNNITEEEFLSMFWN